MFSATKISNLTSNRRLADLIPVHFGVYVIFTPNDCAEGVDAQVLRNGLERNDNEK
jgi:hypothetical protein